MTGPAANPNTVHTENSVRSENAGVPTIREIMVATTMSSLFVALFALVASSFRTRAALQAEILALRHQLAVCQKNAPRRLRLHRCDRLLWVVLYRFWSGWRRCLEIVRPDTVLRWHRRAFAWHWRPSFFRGEHVFQLRWATRDNYPISQVSLSCCRINVFRGGRVAQLGERLVRNEEVAGSIPVSSTKLLCFAKAGCSIRLSAF